MRIYVRVVPGSSIAKVEKIAECQYRIKLFSPPIDGRANAELVKILSKHLGVAKSRISIVGGKTSRDKIVDVGD